MFYVNLCKFDYSDLGGDGRQRRDGCQHQLRRGTLLPRHDGAETYESHGRLQVWGDTERVCHHVSIGLWWVGVCVCVCVWGG